MFTYAGLTIPLLIVIIFMIAIEQEIVPIITSFEKKEKKKLGYVNYKAWDTKVDVEGLSKL